MRAVTTLTATALLLQALSPAALVAASPTGLAGSGVPLTIPLVRRDTPKTADEFLRKARKVKQKYASPNAVQKRATGAVTLTDEQGSEYYGTIAVGTPPVTYNVVMDTGSSDLILATSPGKGALSTTPLYNSGASSSSKMSTIPFQITYGSGSASGTLAQDVVSIGGYAVAAQTFAACTTLNNIVTGTISGLLGMGFQTIASSGALPLVQALAQNGSLPQQVFAFAFDSYSSTTDIQTTAPGGSLSIGALDTSKFTGNMNWVNIQEPGGYWAIPLDGVSVGGSSLGMTTNQAVIDTGTSLVGVPTSAANAIYAKIPGSAPTTLSGDSGYYTFPCSASPNVTFTFGGVAYSMPPDAFNAGAVDQTGRTCLGAVFAMPSGSTVSWIFGDAFLTGVYTAFRFSTPQAVGFATLGTGGKTSTTASGSSSSSSSSSGTTSSSSSAASAMSTPTSGATKVTFVLSLGLACIVGSGLGMH